MLDGKTPALIPINFVARSFKTARKQCLSLAFARDIPAPERKNPGHLTGVCIFADAARGSKTG